MNKAFRKIFELKEFWALQVLENLQKYLKIFPKISVKGTAIIGVSFIESVQVRSLVKKNNFLNKCHKLSYRVKMRFVHYTEGFLVEEGAKKIKYNFF